MSPALDKLDTARPASSGSLLPRIFSALLLVPITLTAIHFGGRLFAATVAFACVVMLFEWTRMVERKELSASFYALALAAMGAFFAASHGAFNGAFIICSCGGVIAWVLAKRGGGLGFWPALAAFYILMPCIALLWLRFDFVNGRELAYILFIIVWAADTGASFLGKFIGGPKISYALSPSKTWAGIGGGILGGALIGPLAAWTLIGPEAAAVYIIPSGLLGAASVVGDLAESAFKRNFGVKDISGFIPGHGGALDRLDGMIFATTAMTSALFVYMVLGK